MLNTMKLKRICGLASIPALLLVVVFIAGSCGRSSTGASISTSVTLNKYDRPTDVTASPDGSKLYVANNLKGTISIVNPSTLAITSEISVSCNPRHIAINSGGTKMYVAHDGASCKTSPLGTVYDGATVVSIVDLATNKVTKEIDLTAGADLNNARELVWDNARSQVYVATFDRKQVAIIDTATQAYKAKAPTSSGNGCLVGLALSSAAATKQTLIAGGIKSTDCGDSDNLEIIDPSTNAKFAGSPWTSSNFSKPAYIAISSNDKYAFVSNYGSSNISVIDITSPEAGWNDARYLGSITVGSAPTAMALTSDNAWLLVLNSSSGTMYSIPWGQLKNGTDAAYYGYSFKVGTAPSDIAIIGDYAYVTDQGASTLYKLQFKSASAADDIISFAPVVVPPALQ